MSIDPANRLGDALTEAFASSHLTVEQVSAATRIRATLIRDLCAGRTDSSGGEVYARGHLKAIAHATGTDPEPLLRAYESESGSSAPAPVETQTISLPGRRTGSLALPLAQAPERRSPRWGLAIGAATAVLVGLVVVGNLVGGPARPQQQLPAAAGTAPALAPVKPVPTLGPGSSANRPAALLRVRVLGGSSWVQVKQAGAKVFEGVLPAGTVRDFNATQALAVKVGNAGAVSLICGGKDVPAGGSGQVKSFSCAQSGLVPA